MEEYGRLRRAKLLSLTLRDRKRSNTAGYMLLAIQKAAWMVVSMSP
jgi:hypothetical protein